MVENTNNNGNGGKNELESVGKSFAGLSISEGDREFREIVNMLWITVPKNTPVGEALAHIRERAHQKGVPFYDLVHKVMSGMARADEI